MRTQKPVYTEVRAPRGGKEENEYQIVSPKNRYVYGTGSNSALVHGVARVKLRWWTCGPGGHYLVRLQSPRMIAETLCGTYRFIDSTKAKTCDLPKPDAVLCGRCHGGGVNFPRKGQHIVPRSLAKLRLGCIDSVVRR